MRYIKNSEFQPLIRSLEELDALVPTIIEDGTVAIPSVKLPMCSPFDLSVHPSLLPLQNLSQDPDDDSILISDISSSDTNTWPFQSRGDRGIPPHSDVVISDPDPTSPEPISHR